MKSLAQHLVEKWLKVVKTEQWQSMVSDKESVAKQETVDNLKSECGGHLTMSISKNDSGLSSESINNSTTDSKTKIDKIKSKNENEKIKERIKKDNTSTNSKIKDDNEKNKEKLKIEKIKDDADDIKEKRRRLKDKNGNPFLKIMEEMNDVKSDEDKLVENDNSNLPKNSTRRKQNLKNLSTGEKFMKLKLTENKKNNSDSNSSSDTKKESRPFPLPAPKPKLPESKTILEKKNYSINVEKKEYVGEKKPTVKTFKSKFRSTGLEEQAPPPPSLLKSKIQSKKSGKNLTSLSLLKTEKRSLSPPSDSPNEKKMKSSTSDIKKPPRKIFNLIFIIYLFFYYNEIITVSVLIMNFKYGLLRW